MPRSLNHTLPDHIDSSRHHFYVTQCIQERGSKILLDYAPDLVKSIERYHTNQKWFCRAYIIMPDHLHLLISPFPNHALTQLMQDWKRYTAKNFEIKWQKNFFEHRLRSDESANDKAYYMELNPIRAGLVKQPTEWKWFGYFH
jgi:putative transposase